MLKTFYNYLYCRPYLKSLQKLRKKRKGELRKLQLISTDDWDITDSLDNFQDIMDILEVGEKLILSLFYIKNDKNFGMVGVHHHCRRP